MTSTNNYSDSEMDQAVYKQMVYKSNYTEAINKQMQVPDTITVVQNGEEIEQNQFKSNANFLTSEQSTEYGKPMEVPDRIVVSVGEKGVEFSEGEKDFSKMVNPSDEMTKLPVFLQTPPRVLTLEDRNLDSLDIDLSNAKTDADQSAVDLHSRDEDLDLTTLEELDDVTKLKKEVTVLHREFARLKQDQSSRLRLDYCMIGINLALWLWFLYSNRRPY